MWFKNKLLILSLCLSPLVLNSCSLTKPEFNNNDNTVNKIDDPKIKEIYELAIHQKAFEGTFDEWLLDITKDSLKKPVDIKTIEFQKIDLDSANYKIIFNDDNEASFSIPIIKGYDDKNAYEVYLESHKDYNKSEEEWLKDLVNNNLDFKERFKVSFKVDDDVLSSEYVYEDNLVTKPKDPTKENKKFVGWFNNETKWDFTKDLMKEDLVLVAKFAPIETTVKFINNDVVFKEVDGFLGEKIGELPTAPEVTGYDFVKYEFNDKEVTKDTLITSNMEVKAIYKKHIYTINIYDTKGTNTTLTYKLEYKSSLDLPAYEDVNYFKFLHFKDDKTNEIYKSKINSVEIDLELYAVYEDTYIAPISFDLVKENALTNKEYDYQINQEAKIKITNLNPSDATFDFDFVTTSDCIKLEKDGSFKTLKAGTATIKVTSFDKKVSKEIEIKIEDIIYNQDSLFSSKVTKENAEVSKVLEKKALEEFNAGIPLTTNEKGFLVSDSLSLNNLNIPGFDDAIFKYATLKDKDTLNLINEYQASNLKTYDEFNTQCKKYINLLHAKLYDKKVSKDKKSYEMYPSLAKEFPTPLDLDENNLASTFEIKLKGRNEGAIYRSDGCYFSLDGLPIVAKDYVTALKLLILDRGNNYRLEFAHDYLDIKNLDKIYRPDPGNFNPNHPQSPSLETTLDKNIGLEAINDNTLKLTLNTKISVNELMHRLYQMPLVPIPNQLLDLLDSPLDYATSHDEYSRAMDHMVCSGPYLVRYFINENGGEFLLERNDDFVDRLNIDEEIKNTYTIPNIKISYKEGISRKAYLDEFNKGNVDFMQVYGSEVASSSKVKRIKYGNPLTLTLNSQTKEEQDYNFYNIYSKNPFGSHYNVFPLMHYKNFLKGIYHSINRVNLAKKIFSSPTQNIIDDDLFIDLDSKILYNETNEHKEIMKNIKTEAFGYDYDLAVSYFKEAINEAMMNNDITLENQTINLTMTIDFSQYNNLFANEITKNLNAALNDPRVCNNFATFNVVVIGADSSTSESFNKMHVARFDIGLSTFNQHKFVSAFDMFGSFMSTDYTHTINWAGDTDSAKFNVTYLGNTYTYTQLYEQTKFKRNI